MDKFAVAFNRTTCVGIIVLVSACGGGTSAPTSEPNLPTASGGGVLAATNLVENYFLSSGQTQFRSDGQAILSRVSDDGFAADLVTTTPSVGVVTLNPQTDEVEIRVTTEDSASGRIIFSERVFSLSEEFEVAGTPQGYLFSDVPITSERSDGGGIIISEEAYAVLASFESDPLFRQSFVATEIFDAQPYQVQGNATFSGDIYLVVEEIWEDDKFLYNNTESIRGDTQLNLELDTGRVSADIDLYSFSTGSEVGYVHANSDINLIRIPIRNPDPTQPPTLPRVFGEEIEDFEILVDSGQSYYVPEDIPNNQRRYAIGGVLDGTFVGNGGERLVSTIDLGGFDPSGEVVLDGEVSLIGAGILEVD